jgi:hypothetical protein
VTSCAEATVAALARASAAANVLNETELIESPFFEK